MRYLFDSLIGIFIGLLSVSTARGEAKFSTSPCQVSQTRLYTSNSSNGPATDIVEFPHCGGLSERVSRLYVCRSANCYRLPTKSYSGETSGTHGLFYESGGTDLQSDAEKGTLTFNCPGDSPLRFVNGQAKTATGAYLERGLEVNPPPRQFHEFDETGEVIQGVFPSEDGKELVILSRPANESFGAPLALAKTLKVRTYSRNSEGKFDKPLTTVAPVFVQDNISLVYINVEVPNRVSAGTRKLRLGLGEVDQRLSEDAPLGVKFRASFFQAKKIPETYQTLADASGSKKNFGTLFPTMALDQRPAGFPSEAILANLRAAGVDTSVFLSEDAYVEKVQNFNVCFDPPTPSSAIPGPPVRKPANPSRN